MDKESPFPIVYLEILNPLGIFALVALGLILCVFDISPYYERVSYKSPSKTAVALQKVENYFCTTGTPEWVSGSIAFVYYFLIVPEERPYVRRYLWHVPGRLERMLESIVLLLHYAPKNWLRKRRTTLGYSLEYYIRLTVGKQAHG